MSTEHDRIKALESTLKDLRWRLDDISDQLTKEGWDGSKLYGLDEWSVPIKNISTAIGVIDSAIQEQQS